jgi:ubiquinone/menaquinone biosynthesis C-methylase UbiE
MNTKYFLPGTDKQLQSLLTHVDINGMKIIVLGTGCEEISKSLLENGASEVTIIVEDNDSLLNARLYLSKDKLVSVKMMEYENTDFRDSQFDLVYAQASISNKRRNKIVKEVKRILKPEEYFCVGENISYSQNAPVFVKDLWESSEIVPLFVDDLEKYYEERKFEIIFKQDLSHTLKDFYKMSINLLENKANDLTDQEKSYHKKFLNKLSHESNAYLKLGGNDHIGFKMLILKVKES